MTRIKALAVSCVGLAAGLAVEGLAQQGTVRSEEYHWRNVKLGGGGFIPGIVFNARQQGLAFCRTDIGSSYKWDSKSRQWLALTDWCGVSNLHGSESIATDPVDPNRLYIAQGMYLGEGAAIMRSMDQGRTFQVVDVPFRMGGNEMGRSVGERLAIDPGDHHILYFGSRRDGLWISRDAALTWGKVTGFPVTAGSAGPGRGAGVGLSFVLFDPATVTPGKATGTIYVGSTDPCEAHLLRSVDAGKTWQAVPGAPKEFVPIHGAFDTQGMLYLVYDNGPGPYGVTHGGVWRLNTKDGAWTDITPDKDPNRAPGGYGGIAVDLHRPGAVVVATLNRKIPGGDDEYRIYRTLDSGKTWKDISPRTRRDPSATPYVTWIGRPTGDLSNNPGASLGWWIATLAIDPFDSNHVCYATGTTIWNCTDFASADADKDTHWSIWTEGIEETAILDLVSPTEGAHLISGFGDIGGYTHNDLNASPKAEEMHLHPLFTNTNTLDYAEKNPKIIIRTGTPALHIPDRDTMAYSEDGGMTWKAFTVGQAASPGRGPFGARGGGVILNADGSVFMSLVGPPQISKDRGKTWTACQGLPQSSRPVADRVNPARFYAYSAGEGTVYRSTDAGATFTAHDVNGLPGQDAAAGGRARSGGLQLKATLGKEGDLWAMGRTSLYHSADSGATFRQVAHVSAMAAMGFGKAAPGKDYPAVYMAGTCSGQQGVFRSDDTGKSWVRINDDQHQYGNRFRCITGDPRIYGRVYAGTDGRGIVYGDTLIVSILLPSLAIGQNRPKSEPYAWKNVQMVGGGFVDGIVFHPTAKGVRYARTDMGGAYRWSEMDHRWQPILDWVSYEDLNLMGVESIAVDPSDPNRVYLACGTYTSLSGPNAILRSSDQGRTFQRTDVPFRMGGNEDGRGNGERMAVDPHDGRFLFMGTRLGGLWASEDRGATWTQVTAFPDVTEQPQPNQTGQTAAAGPRGGPGRRSRSSGVIFVVFDPSSSQPGQRCPALVAGVSLMNQDNLFVSRDAGKTWQPVPGYPRQYRPTHAALSSDGSLYVTYGTSPGPSRMSDGAVWRVDLKAGSWTDVTPDKPGNGRAFGYAGVSVDARSPKTLIVSSFGRPGGEEVFRSTDAGQTWKGAFASGGRHDYAKASYIRHTGIHWLFDVEIDPADPNHAIFTTGYGGHETFNLTDMDRDKPTVWHAQATGIEETVALELLSPPKGAYLISAVGDYGGFVHWDLDRPAPEGNFDNPHFGNTDGVACAELRPEVVVRVGIRSGGRGSENIGYSLDGGKTWQPATLPQAGSSHGHIAVNADGRAWVWTPQRIAPYVTFDQGKTWTACQGLAAGMRVTADRVNPETFYALDLFGGQLFVSKDQGKTFEAQAITLPNGLPQPGRRGDSRGGQDRLYVTPGKQGDLWIAAFDGLYHSTDAGKTFVALAPIKEIHAFGFGKAAPGTPYPALYLVGIADNVRGVFRSDDTGKTWVRINDDQHQWGLVLHVTGDPKKYGRVYVGTHGRGTVYGDPVAAKD